MILPCFFIFNMSSVTMNLSSIFFFFLHHLSQRILNVNRFLLSLSYHQLRVHSHQVYVCKISSAYWEKMTFVLNLHECFLVSSRCEWTIISQLKNQNQLQASKYLKYYKKFANLQNFALKSDLVQISEPHGPVLDPDFWQSGM